MRTLGIIILVSFGILMMSAPFIVMLYASYVVDTNTKLKAAFSDCTQEEEPKSDETFIEDEITLRLRFPKKWNAKTKGDIQEILNKYIEDEWGTKSDNRSNDKSCISEL